MQLIDLTFACYNDMPRFPNPWIAHYSLQPAATHDKECRSVMNVTFCTHAGTHVDAPYHFVQAGHTVDQIPLERLYGPATILDFSHKGPQEEITREELLDRNQGRDLKNKIAVIYTRWYDRWPGDEYYRKAPFIGMSAADWLIAQQLRAIATDLPTLDDARLVRPDKPLPVHVKVLGADIPIIECLTDIHRIPTRDFTLIAFPLKLVGADGSLARVVALVE
jgi:arylformamidase